MITVVIYLFALLTTPTDKIICDLWTRAITKDNFFEACGTLQLEGYKVQVYDLGMKLLCTRPGTALNNIAKECNLNGPLDEYILRITQPLGKSLLCIIESTHADKPRTEEIAAQCPEAKTGQYLIEFAGIKSNDEMQSFSCPARDLTIGNGLYEQVSSANELHTEEELTWLAGKLIWNGYVNTSSCNGSGLTRNLKAGPCGMLSARFMVTQWQNQFDIEIYQSAVANNVPAKLLKRMMMIESQFWPYYDAPAGEIGVMQVTDNGLDTFLRFDPAIDPDYFNRDDAAKFWSRSVTRDQLKCVNCNMEEAIAHIKNNMNMYARLLAAFHCRAVTINSALIGEIAWRQSVVDYNGSAEYLTRIEQ